MLNGDASSVDGVRKPHGDLRRTWGQHPPSPPLVRNHPLRMPPSGRRLVSKTGRAGFDSPAACHMPSRELTVTSVKPALWIVSATAHPDCVACDALAAEAVAKAEDGNWPSLTNADAPPDAEVRHFATVIGGQRTVERPRTRK